MNGTQRLLVIVGLVVVAALAFVVLKAGEDSGTRTLPEPVETVATAPPVDAEDPAGENGRTRTSAPARPRSAAPAVPQVVVREGEPVDGVKELVFRKGDTIRFAVVSDQPDEVHLHGYDVELPVGPGAPARFVLPADIEGIFEAELHGSGTQIASVTVEP